VFCNLEWGTARVSLLRFIATLGAAVWICGFSFVHSSYARSGLEIKIQVIMASDKIDKV
jgi:hypothetical protein